MRTSKSKEDQSSIAQPNSAEGELQLAVSTHTEQPQALVPALSIAQAKTVADRLRFIIEQTSLKLGTKKYLRVEGWKSVAAELNLCPEIESLEWIQPEGNRPGGVRARAILRRMVPCSLELSFYSLRLRQERLESRLL